MVLCFEDQADIFKTFRAFKLLVDTFFEWKIKAPQSHSVKEFISCDFQSKSQNSSIVHCMSSHHNPQ